MGYFISSGTILAWPEMVVVSYREKARDIWSICLK